MQNNFGENISVVFGCGGNRDKKKRPIMAKIANDNCKKIYVTDDNPRDESPKKIRGDIIKCISNDNSYNIGNRTLAITKAIKNADPKDNINCRQRTRKKQIYKNKIINISDKEIVKKIKYTKIFK